MVAILVLLTIIGFVLADWIGQVLAARRVRQTSRREEVEIARGHHVRV